MTDVAVRDALITAGVLRAPAPEAERKPRPGAYSLDDAAIVRASALIFASTPTGELPSIITQADPRIAERLRYLAARHGLQTEAA